MNQSNYEDPQFTKLYREMLSEELRRPEIQSEKKKFLSEFFQAEPAPIFSFLSAGFLAPAALVLAGFFFLAQFQTQHAQVAGPSAPLYQMFAPALDQAQVREKQGQAVKQPEAATYQTPVEKMSDPVLNHMKPRVVVKRISSRTGATMVYQRAYRDVPVTIVWVFAGKGGLK